MKSIGQIVYKDPLVNHKRVEYIDYIPYLMEEGKNGMWLDFSNIDLPTLFVGWKFMNSLGNPDNKPNLSILNKEIINNKLYWEFSFNENKSQHISGIDMFVRNVPTYYYEQNYEYRVIDPVYDNIKTNHDLERLIDGIPIYSIYYYKNDMVYLLVKKQQGGHIIGIDWKMFEFYNLKQCLVDILNSELNNHTQHHYDLDGDIFAEYNKKFSGYDNLKRYLVVLLSK